MGGIWLSGTDELLRLSADVAQWVTKPLSLLGLRVPSLYHDVKKRRNRLTVQRLLKFQRGSEPPVGLHACGIIAAIIVLKWNRAGKSGK